MRCVGGSSNALVDDADKIFKTKNPIGLRQTFCDFTTIELKSSCWRDRDGSQRQCLFERVTVSHWTRVIRPLLCGRCDYHRIIGVHAHKSRKIRQTSMAIRRTAFPRSFCGGLSVTANCSDASLVFLTHPFCLGKMVPHDDSSGCFARPKLGPKLSLGRAQCDLNSHERFVTHFKGTCRQCFVVEVRLLSRRYRLSPWPSAPVQSDRVLKNFRSEGFYLVPGD